MMHISRRSLMHSAAGLVVAFCLPRTAEASATTVAADSVDAFLAIAPDGSVTVFSAPELGPRSVKSLPRSWLSRPGASRSSRVIPPLPRIRDRPAAAQESWSAACRSGKRRRPHERDR